MSNHVPDLTDSEAPHLGKGQPPWGDLPYLSEMIHWVAVRDAPPHKTREAIRNVASENQNKVNQLFALSTKLGLLGEDEYRLLPSGQALARVFEIEQTRLDTADPSQVTVGRKSGLVLPEQSVYQAILFERDLAPMVATLHQVATTTVPSKEREGRANEYQDRVNHLEKYQDVNSPATWQAKLKPHLDWLTHLDLAIEEGNVIQLTEEGHRLYEQLAPHYPEFW